MSKLKLLSTVSAFVLALSIGSVAYADNNDNTQAATGSATNAGGAASNNNNDPNNSNQNNNPNNSNQNNDPNNSNQNNRTTSISDSLNPIASFNKLDNVGNKLNFDNMKVVSVNTLDTYVSGIHLGNKDEQSADGGFAIAKNKGGASAKIGRAHV